MKNDLKEKIKLCVLYATICFAFTLPYGLYHLNHNGIYVLSSTGVQGGFLVGHNDDIYKMIVDTPPYNSDEFKRLIRMDYSIFHQLDDTLKNLNYSQQQDLFLDLGLKWCKDNPDKFLKLIGANIENFLKPGFSKEHHPFKMWLLSFIIALPIYLFAYISIIYLLIKHFKKHYWILGLFLNILIFSFIYHNQNRYRTITLEPYYIIYTAFGMYYFVIWLRNKFFNKKSGGDSQISISAIE